MVFLLYKGKCADCGKLSIYGGWLPSISRHKKFYFSLGGLEIHHIISVAMGGINHIKNLILLCPRCHKLRHGIKV
jgi:5-methylcytosine-specific restriction endonuclease McrA